MEISSAAVVDITDARRAAPACRFRAASAPDLRIDGWLVQPSLNRLERGEVTVRLRAQLMDVLLCLASQPGKVFGKEELMAVVWDGRWVAASAFSRCIAELRSALGDDAQRPRIIQTIPKRGYRLIAPVAAVYPPGPAASPAPPASGFPLAPRPTGDEGGGTPGSLWQWVERAARRLKWAAPTGS